jgi:hypothetical protein
MSDNRFHIEVYLPKQKGWVLVKPTDGAPYVFTKDEAEQYIKTYSMAYGHDRKNWRIVAAQRPLPVRTNVQRQ